MWLYRGSYIDNYVWNYAQPQQPISMKGKDLQVKNEFGWNWGDNNFCQNSCSLFTVCMHACMHARANALKINKYTTLFWQRRHHGWLWYYIYQIWSMWSIWALPSWWMKEKAIVMKVMITQWRMTLICCTIPIVTSHDIIPPFASTSDLTSSSTAAICFKSCDPSLNQWCHLSFHRCCLFQSSDPSCQRQWYHPSLLDHH